MTKRKIIIVVSGLVIVAFSFFSMQILSGMKETPPKQPPAEIIRYVKAEPVEYKNMSAEIEASGRVKSSSEIVVTAEASGEILSGELPFKIGQNFTKGDLLVKIYDDDAVLILKAQKSSFLNRIANVLPDLKLDFPDRYNEWLDYLESVDIEKDLPSLPEINSTQEKVLLASRNLLSDYYSIKSQEILLKRYSIFAPFDGTITEVTMEVGAYVNKGARLGKIINTTDMELEVPLEVSSAKWLSIGDEVIIQDEEQTAKWKGTVIRKSDNVDETTQSISIFISLKSSASKPIFKGQYLTAVFKGIKLFNVMRIPRNAVFNSNEVFIVRDGVLAKSEIEIQKVSQKSLYFKGLQEGELIVVEPLINASENIRVRVLNDESQSQASADRTEEGI